MSSLFVPKRMAVTIGIHTFDDRYMFVLNKLIGGLNGTVKGTRLLYLQGSLGNIPTATRTFRG